MWGGFAVQHVALALAAWLAPEQPIREVTEVYRSWVEHGLATGQWVGVGLAWIYPPLALAPMLAASVAGTAWIGWGWLALVALLDAGAFALLARIGDRGKAAAWWWLAFLALVGPVALVRLEAITAPLAVAAVALVSRRPVVAGSLLAIGAWIKIWPVAVLAAIVVVSRARWRVVAATAGVSVVVVAVVFAFGDPAALLGVVAGHAGRGLQLESVAATPWVLAAAFGAPWAWFAWNEPLRTWEVAGVGVDATAAALTPAILVLVLGVLALGAAARSRTSEAAALAPLAIGLVAVLVIANKVGSPQFALWVVAPVVLAVLSGGSPRARAPLGLGLAIAALTGVVYPWGYGALLAAEPWAVALLAARNALWLALLAWAVVELGRAFAGRRPPGR